MNTDAAYKRRPFNLRMVVACVSADRPASAAFCGRTPVPYRPAAGAALPRLEQSTDKATGVRSYRVPSGDYYPSVTTVLGATSSSDAMRDWQESVGIDVARHIAGTQASIGTEVHERLSLYVRGLDAWKGYDSEWDRPIDVRGHWDQLVRCACSRLDTALASEIAMWSDTLRVAGSVDLVAVLDDTWGDMSGKRAVVDFKCLRSRPSPDKTDRYLAQCAAYAVMWTERTGEVIDTMVVAQSVASGGGVMLAVDAPGGRHLDEFVRRKVEFDRLGVALPGRDYSPCADDSPSPRPPPQAVASNGGDGGGGRGGGRFVCAGDSNGVAGGLRSAGSASARSPTSRPFVVWMTGLPASGKSTILRELRNRIPWMVPIGGGEIREWLSSCDQTRVGRGRHSMRVARLVAHLYRSGVSVGVATCSPYPENRHASRGIIGADICDAHIECYVKCPRSVCEERDRHGMYEMARAGHMPWLTGVGDPYVPPESPDIVLDSEHENAAASASRIVEALRAKSLV